MQDAVEDEGFGVFLGLDAVGVVEGYCHVTGVRAGFLLLLVLLLLLLLSLGLLAWVFLLFRGGLMSVHGGGGGGIRSGGVCRGERGSEGIS